MYKRIFISLAALLVLSLSACSPAAPTEDGQLSVVATTTIVSDVVAQVGGEYIQLETLLPVGASPHSFDPTPQDLAKVSDADVVFANGAGLEDFIDKLIESADATDKVVSVSDGIELLATTNNHDDEDHDQEEGEEHDDEEHEHTGGDPHTWIDPNNVIVWVENIADALSQADPDNEAAYRQNAQAYTDELLALDSWIRNEVAQIPEANRLIVTDHQQFGYFVQEYGFTQVGALIPSYSSVAEPTAQELAALEDAIQQLTVKAIFVGNTVNPTLAERVTEDTGVNLVYIYSGSLSDPGGEADSYLAYMRYNVNAFVDALKP